MFKHTIGKHLRTAAFLTAILAFAAACCGQDTERQIQSDDPAPPQGRNANDIFAEVGRAVPGFGGMFIDEQRKDTLDVFVVSSELDLVGRDSGRVAQLDGAINAVPELASARAAQPRIKLLPAQYSFLQLKEWHDRVSGPLLALPGVVLTALDQERNRLLVGINDWSAAADVTATLERFAVPREAVNVEQMELREEMPAEEAAPPDPSPSDPATLQSKIRPLVGGIQIASKEGSCTLGFIAERDNVAGFVTNSHCTQVPGGVEGTVFYQPTAGEAANKVAVESVDPCYFWNGPLPSFPRNCEPIPKPIPTGNRLGECSDKEACRYSDSAFASLEDTVPKVLGFIARPTQTGTITWDPPNTFFVIVGEQSVLIPKTFVSTVGRTSGWKERVVNLVCSDQKITYKVQGKDQVYDYLCQNLASGPGDKGDSGSPVFVCMDKKDATKIVECGDAAAGGQKIVNVKLVGIHWATMSTTGGRFSIFSPIGSITDGSVKGVQNSNNELGPLKKCAENGC
jgi:hypothetical protein